ncbi:Protein kinase C1 inhibitor, pkcI [Thermobacillus xylanilyticus]|jgi:diadenosine tetraphosphate (Ap4A) HIT family hydrolase|uniref:Protein kinase C1 inhibitor, pkcI n=1 Tax=Thermobacillus xylanilyticus TaxID=76633 RepID=A0ABN7RKZ2_THEXY|nr:HIT family protein [Thermobacillus xylanilyticus]CAG5080229.1 Protein kinase C1 inhibitor, pkcI [Thermobacillus xylanilyticus]
MECLGCRIANGVEPGVQIVYENERLACVLDIDPFNEGHLLILPKAHAVDVEELDSATAHAVMDASMKLSAVLKKLFRPDGITVCQNGGKFNDLGHYHMHLIPRYEGDGFSWGEPARPHDAGRRLSETREKIVKAIREG